MVLFSCVGKVPCHDNPSLIFQVPGRFWLSPSSGRVNTTSPVVPDRYYVFSSSSFLTIFLYSVCIYYCSCPKFWNCLHYYITLVCNYQIPLVCIIKSLLSATSKVALVYNIKSLLSAISNRSCSQLQRLFSAMSNGSCLRLQITLVHQIALVLTSKSVWSCQQQHRRRSCLRLKRSLLSASSNFALVHNIKSLLSASYHSCLLNQIALVRNVKSLLSAKSNFSLVRYIKSL